MAPDMLVITGNMNKSFWTLENGYADGSIDAEYPRRVLDTSRGAALDIALRLIEDDFDYKCRGFDQGFRVILNTPGEALKLSRQSFRVPISEDTMIMIRPKMIVTSDGLRTYRSDQRQCYFLGERRLRFFRFYGKRSCEDECIANYTKNECDCVKFSMPSKN